MKTAISLPDDEFDRYERVAVRHGLNRSEFFRRAAARLADELDARSSTLTDAAENVLRQVGGQPVEPLFLAESQRVHGDVEW